MLWPDRVHKVRQQIPIEVPIIAHLAYIAKTTENPFVLSVCATMWITMVGMIRDAHTQRSELVEEVDHAYIFYCEEGKDKGKPFHWLLP